jgi:tetratricopeptide (TPR) repeat protein
MLVICYVNQALLLKDLWRTEESFDLLKKAEALSLEIGSKDGLQATYGNQALILKDWGRLEEALALHKKEEALCLELGNKGSLGYCYWNWGLLARDLKDKATEREKLHAALQIFTELDMPRERDAVQEELEKSSKSSRPAPPKPKKPKTKPKSPHPE